MIKKCKSCGFSINIQPHNISSIHWFICSPCKTNNPGMEVHNEMSWTNGFKQGMEMKSPRGGIGRRNGLKIR